jgi:hypothetical protein
LLERLGEPPIPGTVAREPGGTRGRNVRRRGKGRVKPRGGARCGGGADRGRGGRPDVNNETRLEEMRKSVACAGCVDAEVEAEASGGEDV